MGELWGGASGPDYDPSAYAAELAEEAARDLGNASRAIEEQRRPRGPAEPRSRWEERVTYDGTIELVEVERLDPPAEEAAE